MAAVLALENCLPCKSCMIPLQEKGGAVVGINVETLDENEDTIAAAKEIMKKQGASYQNIYFDSDSEAGKLALSVMTFPTSVLIDSEGAIL